MTTINADDSYSDDDKQGLAEAEAFLDEDSSIFAIFSDDDETETEIILERHSPYYFTFHFNKEGGVNTSTFASVDVPAHQKDVIILFLKNTIKLLSDNTNVTSPTTPTLHSTNTRVSRRRRRSRHA